jgi:hypothetical protein
MEGIWDVSRADIENALAQCGGTGTVSSTATSLYSPTSALLSTAISVLLLAVLSAGALLL